MPASRRHRGSSSKVSSDCRLRQLAKNGNVQATPPIWMGPSRLPQCPWRMPPHPAESTKQDRLWNSESVSQSSPPVSTTYPGKSSGAAMPSTPTGVVTTTRPCCIASRDLQCFGFSGLPAFCCIGVGPLMSHCLHPATVEQLQKSEPKIMTTILAQQYTAGHTPNGLKW